MLALQHGSSIRVRQTFIINILVVNHINYQSNPLYNIFENREIGTATVTEMSAADQMIKFCLDNNIQRAVIDELLDGGFDSLPVLSLMNSEDLKSQKIPVGQRRLILHITKALKSNDTSGGATETATGTISQPTADDQGTSQQTAGLQHPDLYQ